ncbi:hypothetical protein IQ238_12345 [Pleurocapsales cyanobacterium LEGE 06147]|nr:hypothetical protein [Pleurocapsales cyanobacterium LEGE 06147]
MKQVLTLVVKLQVDINQQQLLNDTAIAFASACNWINRNVNPNLTKRVLSQKVLVTEAHQQNRFNLVI